MSSCHNQDISNKKTLISSIDLDQVCLIRVGSKLCRAVALQELSLRSLFYEQWDNHIHQRRVEALPKQRSSTKCYAVLECTGGGLIYPLAHLTHSPVFYPSFKS